MNRSRRVERSRLLHESRAVQLASRGAPVLVDGTSRFCQTDLYRDSKLLMITPDNNLKLLREQVIKDKKVYIMPTNLELAKKLSVRHSNISDELTLEDLKSAKSTRQALSS